MNLKKMLLLASMAMAAVAFAAPAAAQAEVKLTDPKGKTLKKGAKITATSENLTTDTTSGRLECTLVTIHGEVTNAGLKHVTIQPENAPVTTEGCRLSLHPFEIDQTFPVTIDDGTVGAITIGTDGKGEAEATFRSTVFNEPVDPNHESEHNPENRISDCHFVGNVKFEATNETDILHAGPSTLLTTPEEPGCEPEAGTMEGTFTLETSDGTPVEVDFTG